MEYLEYIERDNTINGLTRNIDGFAHNREIVDALMHEHSMTFLAH